MTTQVPARTGVRQLSNDDLYAVVKLLMRHPVHNVFVSARIRHLGMDPFVLGCPVYGFERDGELVALCHAGSNLIPVGPADPEVADAFAWQLGRARGCSSIGGESQAALLLWQALSDQWGHPWSAVREVRRSQPLMMMDADPEITGDLRVGTVTPDQEALYFDAAVKMYTEEVGVSPLKPSATSYRNYVSTLIRANRAYAVIENGRVLFKADIGSVSGKYAQIQGVWIDPAARGQGLAAPMMAEVVRQARRMTPIVSLYVNDFNLPAMRTYQRVGFQRIGEFATVLY